MSIKGFFQNTYYRWGFIFLLMFAFNLLPIAIKKWICVVSLILAPILPIWGLLRCVSYTCADPSDLGAVKMETEQQTVELRMDWSIDPYHRYLGLTTLFYRS